MIIIGLVLLLLAIALYSLKITPILFIRVTAILLLYSAALTYNTLFIQLIGSGIGIYSGLLNITVISQMMEIFIYIIASVIILPWGNYKFHQIYNNDIYNNTVLPHISEYSILILFTLIGTTFLISSGDLISMYLSIELQSFAVYILACIYRESESATSAGLKYFLLGGLSSALILLGSALIYKYTGLTNFTDIYSITSITTDNNYSETEDIIKGLILGMSIITVGFLFKIAGAPFHNWAPDVYDGVPTIITIWLIIMPKLAILTFAIELVSGYGNLYSNISNTYNNIGIYNIWTNLLLISAVLSLLIGTIVGLAQYKIKRLLAYSTISHVGFMLLALAINSEQSIESLLFYLIQYSLTSINIFYILLGFGYLMFNNHINIYNKDIMFISQLKQQFKNYPLLSLSFAICLFSMAGIPPLIGFFAKQMVLYSSISQGYYFISILAILVSVISAYYYIKIIRVLHFDNDEMVYRSPSSSDLMLTSSHSFIIAWLTLLILLFVYKPQYILNSVHIMTLSLFYSNI